MGKLRRYVARTLKAKRGSSLIELIISMFILSLGLSTMAILTGAAVYGNSHGDRMTRASIMAQGKIEDLKKLNYDSIASSTSNEQIEGMTRYWQVTNNSPATDLKDVQVTVEWKTITDETQVLTLSTVIRKQG